MWGLTHREAGNAIGSAGSASFPSKVILCLNPAEVTLAGLSSERSASGSSAEGTSANLTVSSSELISDGTYDSMFRLC